MATSAKSRTGAKSAKSSGTRSMKTSAAKASETKTTEKKRPVTRASSANQTKIVMPEPIVVKKTSGFTLFALLLLALAGIGFGVFGMMMSMRTYDEIENLRISMRSSGAAVVEEVADAEETEKVEKAEEEKQPTTDQRVLVAGDLAFSGANFKNNTEGIVYVSSASELKDTLAVDLRRNIENGKNDLTVKVRMDTLNQIFGMNYPANNTWAESATDGLETDNLVDVKVGKFGQGSSRELAVLFLMKDGSVGYCTAENMMKNGVTVEGKVDILSDIIALQEVTVSSGFGEATTVMALKANGEYYDIYGALKSQGVWK